MQSLKEMLICHFCVHRFCCLQFCRKIFYHLFDRHLQATTNSKLDVWSSYAGMIILVASFLTLLLLFKSSSQARKKYGSFWQEGVAVFYLTKSNQSYKKTSHKIVKLPGSSFVQGVQNDTLECISLQCYKLITFRSNQSSLFINIYFSIKYCEGIFWTPCIIPLFLICFYFIYIYSITNRG